MSFIFLLLISSSEFGMKDDLRKLEVAGMSSRELYVKRKNPYIAMYCIWSQSQNPLICEV